MPSFHFISGLPGSGSALLSGILTQNPAFHAGMSSPVGSLINRVLEQIVAGSEYYSFFDEGKRKRFCRSIFDSYYQASQDKEVIFDTNRMRSTRLHQLNELYKDFKVTCCVRNPVWIWIASRRPTERIPLIIARCLLPAIARQSPDAMSMVNAGVVGRAWTALKEAFYGEYSEKLLLVDYDFLAQHPKQTIKLIYDFIGQPNYDHDFENGEYAQEFVNK